MPSKVIEYCRKKDPETPSDMGSIVRIVIESLALKYRSAVEDLESITGKKVPALHIVGGGCKNTILNQYTANALNRPVITGPGEATATGNILTQLIALKELEDLQQARELVSRSFPKQEYTPENTELWEDAYQRYKEM